MDVLNTKTKYKHKVTKRSLKNFSKAEWTKSISKKDWSAIEEYSDVNSMVRMFSSYIDEALNEVAPVKT